MNQLIKILHFLPPHEIKDFDFFMDYILYALYAKVFASALRPQHKLLHNVWEN